MRQHLSLADVLAIHYDQIERFGGAHGLRDAGQLEAALFRARSGYYADVVAEAAALWESLSQNYPFIDGNKRAAFASAYVFLAINGQTLIADERSVWSFLSDAYESGSFTFARIEEWLGDNVQPTFD